MKNRSCAGFTLKELLVVFIVLFVLGVIFYPVVYRKPDPAFFSRCMNNQRQLAIGLLSYAQDNDETLPLPNDWVRATHMSSDPKVFDCPTSDHQGSPLAPDYGMNAFLYAIDPRTGSKVSLAIGTIDDPTNLELTTEIKGPTGKHTGDMLRDAFTNPFPNTYTANGYHGKGTTVDFRHNEGVIVSFADGHVNWIQGTELDAGTTKYNIPYGPGRCYLDFTESWLTGVEVMRRLQSAFTLSPGVRPGSAGYRFDAKKHCLALTGQLATEGRGKSNDPKYDTFIPGTGTARLRIEFTCTEGTKLAFYAPFDYTGKFPAADPQGEKDHLSCAFMIDTEHDYIQTGMLQCFSDQRYAGYKPLTWIDLPPLQRGLRNSIPASARKFIVEAAVEGSGGVPVPFPTQRRRDWQLTADKEQGKMVALPVRLKVTIPGYPVNVLHWQGLWIANAHALEQNGRLLRVTDGTVEITRLMYSACPLVASNK